MSLRLLTLGGLRVLRGASELSPFQGQPVRTALLVIVGVERETSRDAVAELLWPDREPTRARHALSQTVYQLRKDLGEEAIVTVGDQLRLGAGVAVDAGEFEEAVEEGRYAEALERYRGHFLDGVRLVGTNPFELWADRRRSRLERLHRTARKARIGAAAADGDLRQVLAQARRWVELDPLDDEAHHALIDALARTGKRSEALRHFDAYAGQLADDLQVEPLEQTAELVERIRAGDVGRGAPVLGETPVPGAGGTASPPARPPHERSLAVLPFLNLGPDAAEEYLSDGITEELINTLARVKELHVAARTSSFAFKAHPLDAREIGQRLSVRWLLEGSVRKLGERIRISAQLVDADDGYHLWSDRYDRQVGDLFDIQEEIARAIVGNLRIRLGTRAEGDLVRPGTSRQEAYHLYLLGRHHWNRRTPEGLQSAVEYLRRSIEEDPNYGRAHAGLADAYIAMAQFQYVSPTEIWRQAEEAVARAVEVAPGLAEAHTSRAHILEIVHWDWAGAEDAYRRAIRLNPDYATARAWYADLLTALGRHDESRMEMASAEALEPLSVPIRFQKGSQLYRARRPEEALPELRRVVEMEPRYIPAHAFAGLAHLAAGRPDEAIAGLGRTAAAAGPNPVLQGVLAHILGRAGRMEEADALVRQMDELARDRYVPPILRALAEVGLAREDRAFGHLEEAVEERHGQLVFLGVDPVWDPIRDDARFDALLERLGHRAFAREGAAGAAEPGRG